MKTLERVISKAGLGSRTEARSWIGAGRVCVNGKVVQTPDHWVDLERDRVTLDGKPVKPGRMLYILLYKPTGYITTYRDPEGRPTVYDLLDGVDSFVGTVGRLDQDTSGLLLLTNDNAFAERVTNPGHEIPKTYLVKTSTLLSEGDLNRPDLRADQSNHFQALGLEEPPNFAVFTLAQDYLDQTRGVATRKGAGLERLEQFPIVLDTGGDPPNDVVIHRAADRGQIHLGHIVTRVGQPETELAVVREEDQSLALEVETPHRIQVGPLRRKELRGNPAVFGIAARAQVAAGFVQGEIQAFAGGNGPAVELHPVDRGINL